MRIEERYLIAGILKLVFELPATLYLGYKTLLIFGAYGAAGNLYAFLFTWILMQYVAYYAVRLLVLRTFIDVKEIDKTLGILRIPIFAGIGGGYMIFAYIKTMIGRLFIADYRKEFIKSIRDKSLD
jgi:hypothetical protein